MPCVCVLTHVRVCVCVCVRMCTSMCVYIYISAGICIYMLLFILGLIKNLTEHSIFLYPLKPNDNYMPNLLLQTGTLQFVFMFSI
jgi:hypothetical protein